MNKCSTQLFQLKFSMNTDNHFLHVLDPGFVVLFIYIFMVMRAIKQISTDIPSMLNKSNTSEQSETMSHHSFVKMSEAKKHP